MVAIFSRPQCVNAGLAFTESPNRKGLGKGYKGLETFKGSSPFLCCFLGQYDKIFKFHGSGTSNHNSLALTLLML